MNPRRRLVATALATTLTLVVTGQSAHAQPTPVTVTGHVVDGTGHGWPLYARVEAGGQSVVSDPVTGRYSLALVTGSTYDVTVTALSGGYEVAHRTVGFPPDALVQDFTLGIDRSCAAPGYAGNP